MSLFKGEIQTERFIQQGEIMMKRALWLRLDIGGIDLHFRISHYRKATKEKWDTQWCEIDLTLQASNWLNYHISSSEIMLSLEVESLRDGIKALLNDELNEVDSIPYPDATS